MKVRTLSRDIEETFDVRRICRYLPLPVLLLASIQLAGAQSLIDINMGFGAAQDKATGNGIEGERRELRWFVRNQYVGPDLR
jgi:hypothetical protein